MTLRQLRESAGLTQEQLSDATGGEVSQVTISQLELGKIRNPKYSTIAGLARGLKTSSDAIAESVAETVAA